jgi:hypothetical protein
VVDTVTIRYERDLDHPLEDAYRWLTDYRNDDADRAGAVIRDREVVERTEDRIVLEGELETLGRRMDGRAEVELDPPDAWTARLYDEKGRRSGVYRYRLEPTEGPGCRLVVDYELVAPKLRHKAMLWIGRPLIRRELATMWDGFVEAMREELGPVGA